MNQKLLIRSLAWLALALLLSACRSPYGDVRKPVSLKDTVTDLAKYELWFDHKSYIFGEPIHIRATVTNLANVPLTFQSHPNYEQTGKEPVIDLVIVQKLLSDPDSAERRVWSEEHPDQAVLSIELEPGQSYTIEWTLTLSRSSIYFVDAHCVLPNGLVGELPGEIWYGAAPRRR